jgi:hypothetical protein
MKMLQRKMLVAVLVLAALAAAASATVDLVRNRRVDPLSLGLALLLALGAGWVYSRPAQ